jgi:acyl carrier protein
MTGMTTTLDRVRMVAAREFNVDVAALTGASEAADVSGWDSSTHLMLMMALEEEFGVSFEVDEVTELTTIGTIADAINARTGQ